MKPVNVKSSAYIDFIVFLVKYKKIFAKGYTPDFPEEVSVIKKVKNTLPWTYVICNRTHM